LSFQGTSIDVLFLAQFKVFFFKGTIEIRGSGVPSSNISNSYAFFLQATIGTCVANYGFRISVGYSKLFEISDYGRASPKASHSLLGWSPTLIASVAVPVWRMIDRGN
jgi:hypothetical protein